jgi:L-ascorbate metabolism protein UlaG (beta-lactamase superfamily)
MEITWLGHSYFRIRGNKTTIITDPYSSEGGETSLKLTADVVTVSHQDAGHSYVQGVTGPPKLITGPGEYEIGGVLILGIATYHDNVGGAERGKNTIYLMKVDEISLLHCGDLGHMLSAATIEEIGNVDVLLVPVGNKTTIGAATAAELVRRLEPKVVIPMHYPAKNMDIDLEPADKFLKEVGVKEITPQAKLSITKSKLPLTTQVVLLNI